METLDGLTVTAGPTGVIELVNETVPENPLILAIVRVEDPVVPWTRLRLAGFAEMLKSGVVPVEKVAV